LPTKMSDDDAPPTGKSTPQTMEGTYPRYAETPMPGYDGDTDSEPDTEGSNFGLIPNAMICVLVAIMAVHMWTVWTMRADVNILLAYQKEHAQQYKHIIELLQNMKPQFQIIPA